ncbi:mtN3/saliva family protein [Ostertagia ostertagi]
MVTHWQPFAMDLQTFLQILSCSAILTTVCLFLCGIPICIEIIRRKGTQDISGIPFLMGFIGGSFWLRYGFLKDDSVMIIVNVRKLQSHDGGATVESLRSRDYRAIALGHENYQK